MFLLPLSFWEGAFPCPSLTKVGIERSQANGICDIDFSE